MPALRTPTSILEARGAFKKNPARGRDRENEPVVEEEIGGPPACFQPTLQAEVRDSGGKVVAHASVYDPEGRRRLRAIWGELVEMAAPGVLNRSHRMHLEVTCRLVDEERRGRLNSGGRAQLNKYLTQMGMNPAAQSTVSGGGSSKPTQGTYGKLRSKAQEVRAG